MTDRDTESTTAQAHVSITGNAVEIARALYLLLGGMNPDAAVVGKPDGSGMSLTLLDGNWDLVEVVRKLAGLTVTGFDPTAMVNAVNAERDTYYCREEA